MYRARKPSAREKDALNIAFIASPLVSIVLPSVTKDIPTIWWANVAVTAASYAYGYLKPEEVQEDESSSSNSASSVLMKAFKALDYGSGQERGARK